MTCDIPRKGNVTCGKCAFFNARGFCENNPRFRDPYQDASRCDEFRRHVPYRERRNNALSKLS